MLHKVEQLIGSVKEDQLTIQNLESGIRGLKSDLEEEVLNNEKLNTALAVSKSLVNNLNKKYSEAMDQATKSAKTPAEHDKTSKALKKAEEEIVRLTNKSNESLKIITKLRETTVPLDKYEKAFHDRHHLENELEETRSRVTLGEDEVDLFKEKNSKLSKENTNLILLLNNTKGSKEALEKHISDSNRASTPGHPLPAAKSETSKLLSRKELKKLRQKTKRALEKQDHEIIDSNLNESVEALIDPVKNSIDLNDNDVRDSASNNNIEPLDNLLEATTKVVPEVNGKDVAANVMKILSTNPVPANPLLPDSGVNADREAVTERVTQLVCDLLSDALTDIFSESRRTPTDQDLIRSARGASCGLGQTLNSVAYQGVSKCSEEDSQRIPRCNPCLKQERCVHLTGAGKLFKELTEVQITNICNYFSLALISTAEQARDSNVKLTIPSHSTESCAVIPTGDLRAVSSANGEREVFTEHHRQVVYECLKHSLYLLLNTGAFTEKSLKEKAEISPELLETVLNNWRDRDTECLRGIALLPETITQIIMP